MDRTEALNLADTLVTEWVGQTKNQRGYVHDNWKPVDPTARTEAVLRIADWLVGPPNRVVGPRPEQVPVITMFGWPIDGSAGKPTDGQYRYAQGWLASVRASGQPVQVDAVRAAEAIIEAVDGP